MVNISKFFQSSLFKASGVYGVTSILNSAIPFFLMPVLTRYLTPEDYGIVSVFTTLASILGVFIGLSIHGAINRVYFEKEINFKEYISNCLLILLISFVSVFLAVLTFSNYISKFSGVPVNWVIFAVIFTLFQFLILLNLVIYQAKMQAKYYAIFQLGQTIMNFVLSIIFVVVFGMNWQGRLIANSIAVMFFGFISFYTITKNYLDLRLNKKYLIHALKFGVPLIPHTLGGLFMTTSSMFIITNILGLTETGIYVVGLQIGSIISILADAFNRAYAPWLFSKLNLNDESVKIKIVKFTYFYFFCIIFISLILGVSAPLIVDVLLGKSFQASSEVIIWIALGSAFKGMYYMVAGYIFYVYKTYFLIWITFFNGIINIPLTIFLTKINGVIGASQAYCMILLLMFIMTWMLSSKVYKMPWDLRRISK